MFKRILCKVLGHKLPKRNWRNKVSNKCSRCKDTVWSKL